MQELYQGVPELKVKLSKQPELEIQNVIFNKKVLLVEFKNDYPGLQSSGCWLK